METRDEIGQLSDAFNAMTVSLRFFRRSDHAKLLRLQQSTQKAFRNLPEALAIVDSEGKVEIATESARTNFGLVPNARISDSLHPWMVDLYQDAIKSSRPPTNEYKYSIIQHFVNNQEKFYQPRAYSILDDEKKLDGLIIILQDVTLLKQSDEIKKNLFSTISHQLKTPLTSIRMAIHLMLEEKIGGLTEHQADLLVSAREESDRLSVILEDLLDISRIESGNVQMILAPTSPYDLVNEAVAHYRRDAQDKGIELAVESSELLPDAIADKSRIGHVMANLLTNAIRHTPRGGKIVVSVREDGNRVKFSVSDNGIGIPPEYHQKIFEKFFRVPGQDPDAGEGLGLAISREIIRAHGGEISLESSKTPGATFFFTLPRCDNCPLEG